MQLCVMIVAARLTFAVSGGLLGSPEGFTEWN
jgi:hypothetical protein